jgi:hypothetical protein
MNAVLRILAVVLAAVIPGGLLVLSAFVLARILAAKVREQQGPHHFSQVAQAFAGVRMKDVWNETRRSLL